MPLQDVVMREKEESINRELLKARKRLNKLESLLQTLQDSLWDASNEKNYQIILRKVNKLDDEIETLSSDIQIMEKDVKALQARM